MLANIVTPLAAATGGSNPLGDASVAAFRLSNVSAIANAWGLMDTRGITVIEDCTANRCFEFVSVQEGSPRVTVRGGHAYDCTVFADFQTMGNLALLDSVFDCSSSYKIATGNSTIQRRASTNVTGAGNLVIDGMRAIYQAASQATAIIDQNDSSTSNALSVWLGDIVTPYGADQTLLHNGGGGITMFDMKIDAFRGKQRVLGTALATNLNAAGDTTIVLPTNITKFILTGCYVTNCTTNLTTIRASVWSASGGAGDNFAADQPLSGITGTATQLYQLTMTSPSATKSESGPQVYFRVGTPQGSPATADVYILGIDLSVG
jgi:hypothetical protein